MDGFKSWSEYLMKQLQKMYEKRERCDLKVSCNGETFWVHRLLMSASSEYFRKLDDLQTSISLPDEISIKTLRTIIDFVYTGNSTFLKEDINDLFNAASYLDMQVLIKFIEKENPLIFGREIDFESDVHYSGLSRSIRSFMDGEHPIFCVTTMNGHSSGLHSNCSTFSDITKMLSYEPSYLVENELRSTNSLEIEQPMRPSEFSCTVCQKNFSTRMGLWQHKRIHESKKQFTCDICKAKFRFKGNLNRHIQAVHMKEHLTRDFHCDVCEKSFRFKLELKQHSLIHGPKDRYICHLCSETFRWKTSLNKHVSAHH